MKALGALFLSFLASWAHAVPGERIYFSSQDQVLLSGLLFRAPQEQALLLVAHGFQSHSGWFLAGDELSNHGITVLAFDRRGSGLSGGQRGHADSYRQFFDDMAAARDELRRQEASRQAPMHLLANCFGARVAIPFLSRHLGDFRSMILVSPGINMARVAEYSFFEKLEIALGSPHDEIKSPLKDELFVSDGPWLQWIKQDHYSLRASTKGFLRSAFALLGLARHDLKSLQVPLLVVLGSRDQMVRNQKIRENLFGPYQGDKKLIELNAEHAIDFGSASAEYREQLMHWILDSHEPNPISKH